MDTLTQQIDLPMYTLLLEHPLDCSNSWGISMMFSWFLNNFNQIFSASSDYFQL